MKKKCIAAAICLLTAGIFSSCVKDEKPILEQGSSPVKINEAYSNGGRSTYGSIDWVELYNPSDEAVSVGGFVLSDKADKAEKVTIPANTTIAARGFLVVEVDVEGGFGLSSNGDLVYLYDANGLVVDNLSFGKLGVNEAAARVPDGSEAIKVQTPTRGISNSSTVPETPAVADTVHNVTDTTTIVDITVDYTGLVINEVDGNGKFVELYNSSAAPISLAGLMLVKNEKADTADIWWTGGKASIAAGGYYTIAEAGSTTAGVTEATGKGGISPKKNVKFELKTPEGATVIDQFTRSTTIELDKSCTPDYGKGTKYSFSRCPDGVGAFGLAEPSCNAANPATAVGAIETK